MPRPRPRPRLPKRQSDCSSGFQWYVCSAGPGFSGCCSTDPCTSGICPAGNQPGIISSSTTSARTSTRTSTVTVSSVRSSGGIVDTPVPRTSTASLYATYPTVSMTVLDEPSTSIPVPTPTTATVTGEGGVVVVTEAGERSTITLNAGTATVTEAGAGVTGVAGGGGGSGGGGSGGGTNVAPIVGGVVGAVLVLVLVLVAVVVARRRRRRREEAGYGAVAEKQGFFSTLFHGTHPPPHSPHSPTSPTTPPTGFFGLFAKKAPHPASPNSPTDTKHTTSPPPPAGLAELPTPLFAHDRAELSSDAVSAPSQLSTPLYQSSGWAPSAVSTSSTGAVLSPKRETHYSDSSTADGSRMYGYGGSQGAGVPELPGSHGAMELAGSYGGGGVQELPGGSQVAYGQGSSSSQQSYAQQQQHSLGPHAHQQLHDRGPQPQQPSSSGASAPQQSSGLRGGGWPGAGMVANLNNSLRRKTGRAQQQQQQQGQQGQQQGHGQQDTHVMSWMNYESEPGSDGGQGGVIR